MQVNLDFESEQDMVEKARIGLALQPVATALFANSPFRDGKPTGQPNYADSYAYLYDKTYKKQMDGHAVHNTHSCDRKDCLHSHFAWHGFVETALP